MLLLMLAPNGLIMFEADPQFEVLNQDFIGHEELWILPDDVWTSSRWHDVLNLGIQPLRTVSPHALLVWQTGNVVPEDVETQHFDDAQFLWPLEPIAEQDIGVKIVLEPRLPDWGIEQVKIQLSELGVQVQSFHLGSGTMPSSFTAILASKNVLSLAVEIQGILWVEPLLTAKARNGQSATLIQNGQFTDQPFWSWGINGTGVVLGVADSGVDADHACFRNASSPTDDHAESSAAYPAVGIFGDEHRKIVFLNTSIDDNDTPGDSDYRHGTHVIGSLGCFAINNFQEGTFPSNGTTIGYGARLVIQDIVSSEGWVPPPADELLWEASRYGAVIHSDSWGDDTTAYTERTAQFDAYARAMPWSVAFIAPGNSGQGVLEPANGRNVVAISASSKSSDPQRWTSSAFGPTEEGTNGIFLLAPGVNIQSAAADGFWDTNNENLRASSGTSMATPLAASATSLIQQMYEQGWIVSNAEQLTLVDVQLPDWQEASSSRTLYLGEGFTPSGSLLRATLALSATTLQAFERNGGEGGVALQNPYDGWGVLNLSRLIDMPSVMNNTSPSSSLWVHDSFRLTDQDVATWFAAKDTGANSLAGFELNQWDGSGAVGPFLRTGDTFQQRFTPMQGKDIRVRMAFPAQPAPSLVDDLQLRITLEDGTVMVPDFLQGDGQPTRYDSKIAQLNNISLFPSSNETVVGLDIPATYFENISWFDVEVVARFVQPGNHSGSIGLDGDATGFSLIIQGVDRDSMDHLDDDGDGVLNAQDACPQQDASLADENGDGCLDDDDDDGIVNPLDDCPTVSSLGFDADFDGCLDDGDEDGVTDDIDLCWTDNLTWPVDAVGCYPLDSPPSFVLISAPANNSVLGDNLSIEWEVIDENGDGARVEIDLVFAQQPNLSILSCTLDVVPNLRQSCTWSLPQDLPPYYIHDASYVLLATISTTNASPASVKTAIVVTISEGLYFPPTQHDGGVPSAASAPYGILVLASIFCLLGGVAVMRWLNQRYRGEFEREVPAPFRGGHGEKEIE